MIKMKQPTLVLHSHNVPGHKYEMWAAWTVPKTMTPAGVVSWIVWAIDHAPEYYLHNVIINCHGSPGKLHIGTGIDKNELDPFKQLRNKGAIGRIWIIACEVHAGSGTDATLGSYFCSQLAAASGCDVVASDKLQHVETSFYEAGCPWGYVDDYEGNVYCYNGAGSKDLL